MAGERQLSERQKTFCRLVHEQVPPYRAYPMAGYRPHRHNPYRLLRENERVKSCIKDLERKAMKQHEVSVDLLIEQLEEARQNAKRVNQPASEIAATMAVAKLCGLIIDKRENKNVNDMTKDELIASLRASMGAEKANAVLKMMGIEVSDDALPDDPPNVTRNKRRALSGR